MNFKTFVCTWFVGFLLCDKPVAQEQNIATKDLMSGNWISYGRDGGGKRFVSLKQINESNVKRLKVIWTYQTGELKTYEGTSAIEKAAFEATPIMVDETLFFSTPSCRVFALDAFTGTEKWVYDPKVNLRTGYSEITSRGVSTWPASGEKGNYSRRIFVATIDGRLIALDAKSGKTISSFGSDGTINLREGFGNDLSVTSPPAIIGNVLIIGSSLGDNQRFDYPRGTVRAYDVISGKLIWSWDPIPQDQSDKAWSTWNGPKAHQTGAANAWSIISVDHSRDLVFIPTGSPSPDYYGGERKGQNLYGNSIVALRASTGKMVWYFQVVHHDLWDYDIAAQPLLVDISKDGKKIPAVVVGTKMGHIFVLDRDTGKPIFPIEERPVPASGVDGEEVSKTQPFPVMPEPLGLQSISVKDAWGITEEDKNEAMKKIGLYQNKGIFTPPSIEGTLVTPGNVGGINWSGMSYDAEQEILVTNINHLAAIIRLVPREKISQSGVNDKELIRAETGMQMGTPYIMKRSYLFTINNAGMMIQSRPPWGTLVAIDMKSGLKKWEVPLGYMFDPKKYPGAESWGSLNMGGTIVTAGNLTFVAASMDNHFRAFNTRTGEMVWQYLLPASGQATPMSYEAKGRQFVVISAGGHGKLMTKQGDYVVAFGLDE